MAHQHQSPEHLVSTENPPQAANSTRRILLGAALSLLAGIPALSALIPAKAKAASPQGSGRAVVNVVTFVVPPEGLARFLAISVENSQASVKEPGCSGFEVLVAEGEPNTVLLVETYRDEAAYQAHRVTPHFLAFVKSAQEIGATRTAHKTTRYYPV
jgi:quinol monooxygenase YgiN